ncbi:MAG: hypothetical protein RSC05_04470 [Acinetobacter sp.]
MAYVEITMVTAIKMMKSEQYVYTLNCGNYESINESDSIASFLDVDVYYKRLSATINGTTFDNRADALNAINEIFGE